MDLVIPHSWLKDYLKTSATPEKIAECLSLCGPSVERVTRRGKDALYFIEVTTNRVDSASVYGTAREAAAILPRFGLNSSLQPIEVRSDQVLAKTVDYLDAIVDKDLCQRFTAVLIRNVKINPSPKLIQVRLKAVGLRPINNIIDISNYLMIEFGQPLHTFDYDKIREHKMALRASRQGEKITTLDGKEHTLSGDDIVIEDGEGRLIDLAGIMGGKLSAVDEQTKNVLIFVQTYNPYNIRQTSMRLNHRTAAVSLFEKGLDPKQVEIVTRRAIDMFDEICKGKPEKEILDIYPNPSGPKHVIVSGEFINQRLGIRLEKNYIKKILDSLGFKSSLQGETLQIEIPSWRANDINIPEDIVEEVARLYGYHNLPSDLMSGKIPDQLPSNPFDFEMKINRLLKGWGGVEVYTYSMTSLQNSDLGNKPSWILKLKNPLGKDGEYMRLSLAPSLIQTVKQNPQEKEPIWLFEMSNIYLPVRGSLPEEKMMLACIFSNYDLLRARGIVEALLEELKIEASWKPENFRGFVPNTTLDITAGKETLGRFGKLNSGYYYTELEVQALQKHSKSFLSFKPIPKYPPQIEDISLVVPTRNFIGNIIETIKKSDSQVQAVEFADSYENTKTFRVTYQNPGKTLTDTEVEKIRKKIIQKVNKKFGARLK